MNETKTRKKRSIVQQQCPVAKHTNTHIVHVLACRTWGTQRGDCDRATSHVNYARSCVRVYVPRKRTNGRKINKQRMEQIDRNSHFICIYYTHACIAYTVCINICIIIKSTQRKQTKKKNCTNRACLVVVGFFDWAVAYSRCKTETVSCIICPPKNQMYMQKGESMLIRITVQNCGRGCLCPPTRESDESVIEERGALLCFHLTLSKGLLCMPSFEIWLYMKSKHANIVSIVLL